jgi:hypothetical protein
MVGETGAPTVPCVSCREAISVPDRYAHGDHIVCGACRTKHKVVRGDRLRLVLADVGPLRDALSQNEHLVTRLEGDLARARRSYGLGVNGILFGVAFAAYQLVVKHVPISTSLLLNALGIAAVSALLLEAANWSFLGKRSAITRISRELEEARSEGARIRHLLREATRV